MIKEEYTPGSLFFLLSVVFSSSSGLDFNFHFFVGWSSLSSLRLGLTSTLPLSFSLGCGQRFSSSFGWSFLFSWALLPSTTWKGEPGAETISRRSRDCIDGTERLPFSPTPPERAGLRHVQARGTSPVATPEGLEGRSQRGTTRSGKSLSFPFHWGLCKCLWEAPVG